MSSSPVRHGRDAGHGDLRMHERVRVSLPVRIEGEVDGLTRDVSVAGVFINAPRDFAHGAGIHFTIELDEVGGQLTCDGRIVRVELHDGWYGVAVHIEESRMTLRR